MGTLNVFQAYELTIDGEQLVGGSRSAPVQITVDGKRVEYYRSLATATTITPWTGTDSSAAISNFDFLYLESDQNVFLELTADSGGEVGTVVFAIEVQASRPFMLCSDDAYAIYTANFSTGTEDLIDRVRIRNVSGTTANVRLLLVT